MAPSPDRQAQRFADHLNTVLNKTVSRARLVLVRSPVAPLEFDIISRHRALELNGPHRLWLFINQRVTVDDDGHVHTLLYSYRLQTDAEDRKRYLIRWEYLRHLPASNPHVPAHVHVCATLVDHDPPKPLEDMHIASDRVPLELVLWHLITDWEVKALSDDWRAVLEESIEGFIGSPHDLRGGEGAVERARTSCG